MFRFLPRIRVRSALGVIALSCIPLSWLGFQLKLSRERQAAVDMVIAHGGSVWFDYQCVEFGPPPQAPPAPVLLRHLLGDAYFYRVHHVDLSLRHCSEDVLQCLIHFRDLKSLNVAHSGVTDGIAVHLSEFGKLQELTLTGNDVTDDCVPGIIRLHALKTLDISHTKISTTGVEMLRHHLSRTNIVSGRRHVQD